MALQPIALPDAELAYDAQWLAPDEADALFSALRDDIAWQVHRLRLFGREVDAPRLSAWIGDPGAVYTYSRTRFAPAPWPAALAALRTRIEQAAGARFDSVLANRYRDGRDAMGWHSDDEPELGPAPTIASLSLGVPRRFVLRQRTTPTSKHVIELAHGSLLVMRGPTQRHWQHALPRSARVAGERINLTFRDVGSGARARGPGRR